MPVPAGAPALTSPLTPDARAARRAREEKLAAAEAARLKAAEAERQRAREARKQAEARRLAQQQQQQQQGPADPEAEVEAKEEKRAERDTLAAGATHRTNASVGEFF